MVYQCISVKKIAISLIFFGLSIGLEANERETNPSKEVLALDRQMDQAFFEQDLSFLSNILAEEFIWVHAGASPIDSKTTTLKTVAAHPRNLSREAIDINTYGDSAIVSGFVYIMNKDEKYGRLHMQRVYVKNEVGWKLVSQHTTMSLGENFKNDVIQYVHKNYWSKALNDGS